MASEIKTPFIVCLFGTALISVGMCTGVAAISNPIKPRLGDFNNDGKVDVAIFRMRGDDETSESYLDRVYLQQEDGSLRDAGEIRDESISNTYKSNRQEMDEWYENVRNQAMKSKEGEGR